VTQVTESLPEPSLSHPPHTLSLNKHAALRVYVCVCARARVCMLNDEAECERLYISEEEGSTIVSG